MKVNSDTELSESSPTEMPLGHLDKSLCFFLPSECFLAYRLTDVNDKLGYDARPLTHGLDNMLLDPQHMVRSLLFKNMFGNISFLPCKELTLNHLNYWCCPRKPFVVVSSWTFTDVPLLLGFGFVRKKGSRTIWKLLKS